MNGHLLHIADRIFNTPLLLDPAKAEMVLYVLRERLPIENSAEIRKPDELASQFFGSYKRETRAGALTRAYKGVANITIDGSLVNRGAWIGADSGLISYEGLGAQIRDAVNDPEIHSILLDINSPGGEAAGMLATADLIRRANSIKPVTAFVNDRALSGGYALAAQAGEIVLSESSRLGSIGVVLVHLDESGALAKEGIKPTMIFAGDHKVDGNPFGPLPDSVREALQASVNKTYENFIGAVAKGRGKRMTAEAARKTQARTYEGADAIAIGLADRIASIDELMSQLTKNASRLPGRENNGGLPMTEKTEGQPGAVVPGVPKAEHDAAVAKARADGLAEGTKNERDRVSSIFALEEAKGRDAQAMACAKTGATVEMAKELLATSPKGTSVSARAGEDQLAVPPGTDKKDTTQPGDAKAGWAKHTEAHNKRIAH